MVALGGGDVGHVADAMTARASMVDDAPETPAHQFVVRAFKHAIWGTPAPGATERRPRRPNFDTKRPASSGEGREPQTTPKRLAHSRSTSALTSPTKGILLTPGTANNRRKSVSWLPKENVVRAQTTHIKSTPRHFPGHFPTPSVTKDQKVDHIQENKPRQIKEHNKARPTNTSHNMKNTTSTKNMSHEHDCEAMAMLAKLAAEFEDYKSRSERQITKLIAREKMAMNYARSQEAKVVAAQRFLAEAEQKRAKESLRRMALEQDILKHGIKTKEELNEAEELMEDLHPDDLGLLEATICKSQIADAVSMKKSTVGFGFELDVDAVIATAAPKRSTRNPHRPANISGDVFLDTAQAGAAPTRRSRTANQAFDEAEPRVAGARDRSSRPVPQPEHRQLYYDPMVDPVSGVRPHLRGGGSSSSEPVKEPHAGQKTSPLSRLRGAFSPRKPLAETSGNAAQARSGLKEARQEGPEGHVEHGSDAVPHLRGGSVSAAAKQEKPRRAPQLPFDRLEAAKARIAQRNASKSKEFAEAA